MRLVPHIVGVVLWLVAPALLALSLWRPAHTSEPRAAAFPRQVGAFVMSKDRPISKDFIELLGTQDVVWRDYQDEHGRRVFVTAVFHDQNWKSLHPPHICIRGTNFEILEDRSVSLSLQGEKVDVGRLLASRQAKNGTQTYLSMYAFVGQDFVTGSYTGFFLQHAPRALMRDATPGFLLRVETFVWKEAVAVAEARCRKFLAAALPLGRKLIEP